MRTTGSTKEICFLQFLMVEEYIAEQEGEPMHDDSQVLIDEMANLPPAAVVRFREVRPSDPQKRELYDRPAQMDARSGNGTRL